MENYLNSLEGKTALITGASSGIGRETARFLASHKCSVRAIARRAEKLSTLKEEFPEFITTFCGDINDNQFMSELKSKNIFDTDIFINNAGLALGRDLFHNSSDKDNELVIATNIQSAFKLAKYSLSHMLAKKTGDIVNITSIASHEAYAGGVVYAATKHALLAMGKALREETHGQNIRIINISPGLVETEFSKVRFKGDEEKAHNVYLGYTPLKAQDIAFQIVQALRLPRHVNLDEVLILATDQAGATKVARKNHDSN